MGFQAFQQHDPLFLFWFAFAGFFSFFGYRWEQLKYVGLLGVVGLVVAAWSADKSRRIETPFMRFHRVM